MTLLRALNIGVNGLTAASLGSAVTGHNITNANTEGYSRQQIDQRARPLHYGGGVEARDPLRIADQFADRRLNDANSQDGQASARAGILGALDRVFSEDAGSVGLALDDFHSALTELTTNPSDGATRQKVLAAAEQLTLAFNRASTGLNEARVEANDRIELEVTQVNDQLKQIGDLNTQILQAGNAGQDAATLIDTRDQLIRQVAKRVPVTVIAGPSETVNVLLGGSRTLVADNGEVSQLVTKVDANGNRQLLRTSSTGAEDISSLLTSGSLSGYIDARDGALADAVSALDQLAYDVSEAYNAVHTAGYGKDGATGRNLFESLSGPAGAAAAMAVSADVKGQPDALAAGAVSGVAGDNRVALQLTDLAQGKVALGGTATASGALANLVGQVGTAVQSANGRAEFASLTLDQARRLRDDVSGVSTDEEMVNLMRYQRAYQASLRVIETADQMLAELLSMRR